MGREKSAKENATSIWAKDGGMPICIAAMSKTRVLFLAYFLHFDDSTTKGERRASGKLAPICSIYKNFFAAGIENYTSGIGCNVD